MAEVPLPDAPMRPTDPNLAAALDALPPALADAVAVALRERDLLSVLRDAIDDAEQAGSLEARLRAIAGGVQRLGFSSAAIVLVSASGAAEFVIAADSAPANTDELVIRARTASWDEPLEDDAPALAFALAAGKSRPLARLVVGRPPSGYPANREQMLRLMGSQALRAINDARLVEIAERRAARLQRLQEVGGMLARSLDEREIRRELARHVLRTLPCRGIVIAYPDLERGTATIPFHLDGGTERVRGVEQMGPGVLAEVTRSGRPVRMASIGSDAASLAAVGDLVGGVAASIGSILAVPMLVGIQLVGVVAVYGSARTAFNAEDEELLGTIASHAASAIVNARLYEESQSQRRQSEALSDIARAVNESLRMAEVLRLIERHATALLRAQGATVMLRKEDYLHIVAGLGTGELLSGMYLPMTGSLCGRAVRTGHYVIANDTQRDPETYLPTRELALVKRTVIAPLITDRGAIGALAVLDRDTDFTDDDARVLQRLADQVAVAVVNARLYEELSDATRELAITFNSIAGGLATLDDNGRLLRCNPRAAELLGAADEASAHQRNFAQALLGETGATGAWPLLRALAEQAPHRGTVRNAESGRVFDLLASPHPSGGAVVFFDDVTSFHALADRYRDLMERASDAIYTLDKDATITSANEATAALVDLPRDMLIGRSVVPFVDGEDLDMLCEHFRAAQGGEPRQYECNVLRPDGSSRLLSVSNTPIRRGEEVVGVLGIARDVTNERAAAALIERAEARYTRLVESASDSIFTVDEEGLFTSVNPALERAVGRGRDALLGRHFTEIIEESDRGTVWEMFVDALKGGHLRREVRYHGADGTVATGNIVAEPISEGARVTGMLCILRDVTEERALMAQFIRQERLASLGQLVSGVAHELNNPLAGISAHAQLLDRAIAKGEAVNEAARVIAAEASRASKIVGKLLTFVRQSDSERLPVDLRVVLRDTLELRAYGLREHHIEVVTRFSDALPLVLGDSSQLQQVFVNLLANAENAVISGPRERRIEISAEEAGGSVRVTVRDTGIGIPPEHIDRIFNPFFTTKPRGLGTGLGLSISDGIIREHGGRLFVQSALGVGTTFLVELPERPVPDP